MRLKNVFRHPEKSFFVLQRHKILDFLPDKIYLKWMYKAYMGKRLNLENPTTFNEKLQWLKLYDRKPIYKRMVDKYEAKEFVKEKLGRDGEKYIIPTLGVWKHFEDIDFDKLPDQFVLKTTHDSGSVFICKNKADFDFKSVKIKIEQSLKNNFYYYGREWPYRDIHPRIIAEQYLELSSPSCAEYKLFCYNGKVNWVMICQGTAHANNIRTNDGFDRDFNHLPVKFIAQNSNRKFYKPKEWDQLISIAEILAEGTIQLRVDTYLIDGKIYFGELTFFHDSGLCPIKPEEWDAKLGNDLILPIHMREGNK